MHASKKHQHTKKRCIQHSDPGKILDLAMSLTDTSCAELQIKINEYFIEECDAQSAFMIVVHGDRMEAYIETVGTTAISRKMKILMTHRLCDVLKSPVEYIDNLSHFGPEVQNILIPILCDPKRTIKVDPKDCHPDKKRIVMYANPDKPFSIIMCVVSPQILEENVAVVLQECLLFVWPTLNKCINYEYECSLKEKCQQLLRVAKRLFTQVASLETLMRIAMEQAKLLAKAEHCSVKLVDVDRMDLVEASSQAKTGDEPLVERRFPMNIGIAGHVIETGHFVNSRNPTEHHGYNETIDTLPGVQCRNLLCFPIREQTGIIGVGQLINKVDDPYFDSLDEEMALAFSIYCGVCIMHSVVYKKLQEAHVRNALANELVMYHMQVNDSEVAKMLECRGFHDHPHINGLYFNVRVLPYKELPCYIFKMFLDLGIDKRFQIKKSKLVRFILHVKKGYRDVPYHNWTHAFNVAQWAYAALINFRLLSQGYFTELQMLMYYVAAVMHDLDHRGTTNSFHMQGQTTLAALYSSEGSVMERHHLAQAMCILNTEGCDILEKLPRRDYDRALLLLRDFILASDLANYFKNKEEYKSIAGDYQKNNRSHIAALQALLMNCADLSDQLKDWTSVKKTAAAVLTEFFKQGDVEKSRGENPMMIMDREKCNIPNLEIHFLQTMCIPLFGTLARIFPKLEGCVKILEKHIEQWDGAMPVFAEVSPTAGLSVLLSPELDDLIQKNIEEKIRLAEEAAVAAAEAAEAAAAAEAARIAGEQAQDDDF